MKQRVRLADQKPAGPLRYPPFKNFRILSGEGDYASARIETIFINDLS